MRWGLTIFFWIMTVILLAFCVPLCMGIWIMLNGYDSQVGNDSLYPGYGPRGQKQTYEDIIVYRGARKASTMSKARREGKKARRRVRPVRRQGVVCQNRPPTTQCEGAACYYDPGYGPCRGLGHGL